MRTCRSSIYVQMKILFVQVKCQVDIHIDKSCTGCLLCSYTMPLYVAIDTRCSCSDSVYRYLKVIICLIGILLLAPVPITFLGWSVLWFPWRFNSTRLRERQQYYRIYLLLTPNGNAFNILQASHSHVKTHSFA